MKRPIWWKSEKWIVAWSQLFLIAALAAGMAEPQLRNIEAGEKTKVKGIIYSREGDTLRVREESNTVVGVNLSGDTKIQLKHGIFKWGRKAMDTTALVPGLRIEAEGAGSPEGRLAATKVTFNPDDLRSARTVDTRVSPLESRAGQLETKSTQLEGRAGQLENRAGQLETKATELDGAQKQTQEKVQQVGGEADKANTGVETANTRIASLDEYEPKYTATVLFAFGKATLTEEAKQQLSDIAQKAQSAKGYVIEVAGFTDSVGSASVNQALSDKRAQAVIRYLLQEGNIPQRRILTPAGMGKSHSVAENTNASGRKQNRRVEVKVLVTPGLAG